jgi:hypothetical protein
MEFDQLPEDVLLHIASFLPNEETHNPMNMFLVNKRMYGIYEDHKKHIDALMLEPYFDESIKLYILECPHQNSYGFIKLVCRKEKENYEKTQEFRILSNFNNTYITPRFFTGIITDEETLRYEMRKDFYNSCDIEYNRFIITGYVLCEYKLMGLFLMFHKIEALKIFPTDKMPKNWRFNFYYLKFYFNRWDYKENKYNELYVINFMLTNFKYNTQQMDKLIKFLIKYRKFYSIAFILTKHIKLCSASHNLQYISMMEGIRFYSRDEYFYRTIGLLN